MIRHTTKKNIQFCQNPEISFRELEGKMFLVNHSRDSLYYLNETGAAIWNLLKQPVSMYDVATILQQAFPDIHSRQIEKDVKDTFNSFSKDGLLKQLD